MTSSNLPPGVTENMIPGNRPEDVAFDAWDLERAVEEYDRLTYNEQRLVNGDYGWFVAGVLISHSYAESTDEAQARSFTVIRDRWIESVFRVWWDKQTT